MSTENNTRKVDLVFFFKNRLNSEMAQHTKKNMTQDENIHENGKYPTSRSLSSVRIIEEKTPLSENEIRLLSIFQTADSSSSDSEFYAKRKKIYGIVCILLLLTIPVFSKKLCAVTGANAWIVFLLKIIFAVILVELFLMKGVFEITN
jgi:hypothetical protein